MKIFLDTNAIVDLVREPETFPRSADYEYCTFEKCLYEFGNGIKTKLFNRAFIVACLKGNLESGYGNADEAYTYVEKVAKQLVVDAPRVLGFGHSQISQLISALRTFDLRYAFGTAAELSPSGFRHTKQFVGSQLDKEGIPELKCFYYVLKPRLRDALHRAERVLRNLGVAIILYEQLFCDGHAMLDFRRFLEDSYLPTEDLEIVFCALSQGCNVFVSDDGKTKSKGILQDRRTLGLNTSLEFVAIKEFRQGKFHRSQHGCHVTAE